MNFTSTQIYINLPLEKKQEILNNLKKHQKMPIGFYSCVYTIEVNGEKKKYRFQSNIRNGQPIFKILFDKQYDKQMPHITDSKIFFYDKELKRSLQLDRDIFEEQVEKEINYNLSSEEIELLAEGKEITIDIQLTNRASKALPVYLKNKSLTKRISVDYNYFLGKISLFLNQDLYKNNKKAPAGITLNNFK